MTKAATSMRQSAIKTIQPVPARHESAKTMA